MKKTQTKRVIIENAIEYWTRRLNESNDDLLSEENIAFTMTGLENLLNAFNQSQEEHLHAQTFQMKKVVDDFQKIIDDLYGAF